MIWNALNEDTLQQCRQAIANCAGRGLQPAPWFPMLVDLYEELDRAGQIQRVWVEQEICKGCVCAKQEAPKEGDTDLRPCDALTHCEHHFSAAHIDRNTGKVLFCPHKTTQAMLDERKKAMSKRKVSGHGRAV